MSSSIDSKDIAGYKSNDHVMVKITDESEELGGLIRWIGESAKWGKGTWFGIELDKENTPYGHNGYFNGERFFGCSDKCGVYVQKAQIIGLINENDEEKNTFVSETGPVMDKDDYLNKLQAVIARDGDSKSRQEVCIDYQSIH